MEAIEKALKEIEEFSINMMTRNEHKNFASHIIEKQNKTTALINEMHKRQRARNARFYKEFKQDNRDILEQNSS